MPDRPDAWIRNARNAAHSNHWDARVNVFRIRTRSGSVYLVGSATYGARIRVARVSAHPVSGPTGPVAFADDYDVVEFVPDPSGLRLRCRQVGGNGFTTSAIVEISDEEFEGELAADDSELGVGT